MTTDKQMPDEAIKSLREHQQQLDEDGIMVGVSRQAVHEVLNYLDRKDLCKPPVDREAALKACIRDFDRVGASHEIISVCEKHAAIIAYANGKEGTP